MAKWVKLRVVAPGGNSLRCVEHGTEFSPPKCCQQCTAEPTAEEDGGVGELPYLPGLPTPIEDERAFRGMSRQFLEAAQSSEVATVAVKYAELGLRALKFASDMGVAREASYVLERRQREIDKADPNARKALRK